MLGGWASGSKYSFLGAMRGAAQLISYEVSQGLALVGVVMTARHAVADRDRPRAGRACGTSCPSSSASSIFLIASFAETNRAPFDLVEADAELVGGYNTEYGGGALRVLLLRRVPQRARRLGDRDDGVPRRLAAAVRHPPAAAGSTRSSCSFKMSSSSFFFIWIRATLPRLRYDQLMSFGWKVLLPLATLNALVTAIVVVST